MINCLPLVPCRKDSCGVSNHTLLTVGAFVPTHKE